MKKKYDIKINPRRPDGRQIEQYKNFDALLERFKPAAPRMPLLRRLAYVGSAIAALLAGVVFLPQIIAPDDFVKQETAYFANQPFICPPIENIKPQFTEYKLNARQGGTLQHPSGSKLTVPADAFVDQNGKTLEGEVDIRYREMHDFVDFFLSGIPMTYDSAGVQYILESAGMIEIFAEKDGKRVNMAPGKSIDVELISQVNVPARLNVPPGYNIYKLDESKRNWVYTEIDRMQSLEEGSAGMALDEKSPLYPVQKEYKEKLDAISITQAAETAKLEASVPKPNEPLKPQRANGANHVFDLDFDDIKNPTATGEYADAQREVEELYRQYEKMLWQLSPSSSIKPEQLRREFSQVTGIRIRKLNNRDYEMILMKGDQSVSIIANPVLSGSDYEEALGAFNREFEVWQKKMNERESQLKSKREALQKLIDDQKQLAQLSYEKKIAELKERGLAYEATEEIIKRKVVNRFSATSFGIWNCDRPRPPLLAQFKAEFKDQFGKAYTSHTAYLVNKSENTVTKFLASGNSQFRYNRSADNLLWLITEDNKIAVFRPEEFKKIGMVEDRYTFVLTKIDKEIKDERDVRQILYL